MLSEFSLASMEITDRSARLIPMLGDGPFQPRWLSFEEWWNELVLRDDHSQNFSRRTIVLTVADQMGGAHADPAIDANYHRLTNENSIGWISQGPEGEKPLEHIEKVYLRHISWEALASIETAWSRILGNRKCGCGTGRKHRYCCGKKTTPA